MRVLFQEFGVLVCLVFYFYWWLGKCLLNAVFQLYVTSTRRHFLDFIQINGGHTSYRLCHKHILANYSAFWTSLSRLWKNVFFSEFCFSALWAERCPNRICNNNCVRIEIHFSFKCLSAFEIHYNYCSIY